MAASSLGNAPRFLMIFRKDRFTDSTVLVVYMIFRISAGKGKKRNDMLPVPRFPHRADCEVLFTPLLREPIQLLLGGFPAWGSVYFLQVVRDRLSVFGAHIVQ